MLHRFDLHRVDSYLYEAREIINKLFNADGDPDELRAQLLEELKGAMAIADKYDAGPCDYQFTIELPDGTVEVTTRSTLRAAEQARRAAIAASPARTYITSINAVCKAAQELS